MDRVQIRIKRHAGVWAAEVTHPDWEQSMIVSMTSLAEVAATLEKVLCHMFQEGQ